MLPQNTGRTKRVWLGRDEEKAVVKFMALVSQLKGEKEKNVVVKIKPETVQLSAKGKDIPTPSNFKDLLKNIDKIEFEQDGTIALAPGMFI